MRAIAGYLFNMAALGVLGMFVGAFLGGAFWGLAVGALAGALLFFPGIGSRAQDHARRDAKQAEMENIRGQGHHGGGFS